MNIHSILREALALLLLMLVLVIALSLYSFNPQDPSFNHETSVAAMNQAGIVGAYIADFFYQLFGYASWIAILLGVALVVRIAFGLHPFAGGWTTLFWLPCLLGCAGLMAAHADILSQVGLMALPAGAGGALGALLSEGLLSTLHAIGRDLVLGAVVLSSFIAASHISMLALFQRAGVGIKWSMGIAYALIGRWRGKIDIRRDRIEGRERRLETKASRPVHIAESEPEVMQPAKVNVSRKAREQQQRELSLGTPPKSGFRLPGLSLFTAKREDGHAYSAETLQAMARMLEKKLLDYRVEGQVVAVQPGPVVVQFEFEPAPGTKAGRIVALQDDLARSMSAVSVRVAGNIPGKNVIGIEIPNQEREMVLMHDILASRAFSDRKKKLPLALGVDIAGQAVVVDLAKMPHLLVAGTTGSGKSVSINTMICSMLMTYSPQDLRLIMVDPKMLELSMYDDIPHLLVPVVTSPHKAAKALAWAVYEMERRYHLMSEARVRNLEGYNKAADASENGELERLPYIVIVIDELADLMMVAGKEVEQAICRIAQKARAAGLHLILATQRPSVDVITGLIKANLPSRLSFQVSSKIDSRTILDQMGAEQLLGQGDALFMSGGRDLIRIHGAYVSDGDVIGLVEHLKEQGEPEYRHEVFEVKNPDEQLQGSDEEKDSKYDEAAELVIEKGQCSVSMVQRYLRIGYNRASRIVEQMEQDGLVTSPGSGGIRKVLARSEADGGGIIE
ncbi:MAG: DNA translocase FtsK 4TM domain-containing protein [Mariprofundaceae bacterium]|nr:DNA translocase FtsK 4TM domain-containing protein [Mariprofundaceae bacterium]